MTVNLLPLSPILLPIFFAVCALLLGSKTQLQRNFSTVTSGALVVVCASLFLDILQSGTLVTYVSRWAPPFGISIVADQLAALLVFTTSIIMFAAMIYSENDTSEAEQERGFYPLIFMLIAGVNGAFLTGDIFNLYVWYEVMLISSFALMVIGRTKKHIEAAIKYVVLNMIKSLLFLISVGMLYGTLGTLNMADLHLAVQDLFAYGNPAILHVIAIMLLCVFGIKAGMFPLYFWLPASYHRPSSTVSILFAALLTKVGLYSMLRIFTSVLPFDQLELTSLIGVIAMATMLVPILGAISEFNLKRVLSFCLLSHIGVMLAGLSMFNATGFSGTVFYMVHHMLIIALLFMLAGIICRLLNTDDIRQMGGLMKQKPLIAWLFFAVAISMVGIPPLSGFWAKFLLINGGLQAHEYWLVGCILLNGLLTLYAMMRVWNLVFWRNVPVEQPTINQPSLNHRLLLPIALLIAISLYISFTPDYVLQLSKNIASTLLDPSGYVDAVTGGAP